MKQYFPFALKMIFALGAFVIFVLVSQSFGVNWGRLELASSATVTVTGQADGQQISQIATFRAEVAAAEEDRAAATETVNTAVAELIEQVKAFGIPDEDIKTEQISVYEYSQPEILIYPPRPNPDSEPAWQASNSISITLRDVSRASDLATLLTESGATNVSGPNFTVDDTVDLERQLLEEAMADARAKANTLLAGTDQKIKRIVSVSETGSSYPMPLLYRESAAVGADQAVSVPVEPGSQQLYKTITVVFEIGR